MDTLLTVFLNLFTLESLITAVWACMMIAIFILTLLLSVLSVVFIKAIIELLASRFRT